MNTIVQGITGTGEVQYQNDWFHNKHKEGNIPLKPTEQGESKGRKRVGV